MNKFIGYESSRNIVAATVPTNVLSSETNAKRKGIKAIRSTWLFATAVILLMVSAPMKLTAAPIAGPIFNPATGHNYYLLASTNWTASESQALTLGGNLTTINNSAENTWVFQEFSDYGGVARNLWIGLNAISLDGGNPNNYSWIDGDPSAYRNWATGEPNLQDQYVQMVGIVGSTAFGLWNNTSNDSASGYGNQPAIPNYGVVEVVPEPASYLLVVLGGLLLCRCGSRRRAT